MLSVLSRIRSWRAGDWLVRPITLVSTFNIRFTAFFIAVLTHPVEVLVEPLIPPCPHSYPNTEVGMAVWDLSLLIQYRYLPNPRPTSSHFSFLSFRALSLSRLAINNHRSAKQVHAMTVPSRCAHVRKYSWTTNSYVLNVFAQELIVTKILKTIYPNR